LLEHWGMADSQVASALIELAHSPKAPLIGASIPAILPKEAARTRILELLRDPEPKRQDMLANGLLSLTGATPDEEAIAVLAEATAREHSPLDRSALLALLVQYAPSDSRVRVMALRAIDEEDAPTTTIVRSYPHDLEIRRRCIAGITPLAGSLRSRLVDEVSRRLEPHDVVSWLSPYDEESDAEIKTEAAVAYSKAVQNVGDPAAVADAIVESMKAPGITFEERRQAGLAALATLDLLSRLDGLVEPYDQTRPMRIRGTGLLRENYALFRAIGHAWR
jgi:hypothetical protein